MILFADQNPLILSASGMRRTFGRRKNDFVFLVHFCHQIVGSRRKGPFDICAMASPGVSKVQNVFRANTGKAVT